MSLVLFYHVAESEIIRAVRFCNRGIVSVKDISHVAGSVIMTSPSRRIMLDPWQPLPLSERNGLTDL